MSKTHPIPDAALDADITILAQKGAGKTFTAKGLIETLLDQGERVLIVDPLSTWWGLKASSEGKSAGYPVAVFGGPHGDMDLTESMAEPLAVLFAANNLPAVLDIAFMKKSEQMRFCKNLFEILFAKNRDPLTLVLEEAHVFAPQSMSGGDAHVFHQVDRIARMGRAFGFRLITITQRPARIHKDILSQAATMIAMRVRHPLDQKPVMDWFRANGTDEIVQQMSDELGKLKVGEGFVGAADLDVFKKVKFPLIKTFDSSATPKRGEKRIIPTTLAKVDLREVKAALKTPDKAKPVTSKEKPPPKNWKTDLKAEYERGKCEAEVLADEEIERRTEHAFESGRKRGRKDAIEAIVAIKPNDVSPASAPAPEKELPLPPQLRDFRKGSKPPKPKTPKPPATAQGEANNPLVLAAVKFWPANLTWAALCAADNRKPRGGHFNGLKKRALESGLIRDENGLVVLTNPPPDSGDIAADLLEKCLPEPARTMFAAIRETPSFSWEFYAEQLGRVPRGGYWNGGRAILRNSGLVIEESGGAVNINPSLLR